MKVSIWLVVLVGYMAFIIGAINQVVGVSQDAYILDWWAPFGVLFYIGLPAWFGYEFGREGAKE